MADRELPAGNVSLLFTDIEGSTRLIKELGESGYVDALAEHRRLLRAAFSAHGGVEVDTQGTRFCMPLPIRSRRWLLLLRVRRRSRQAPSKCGWACTPVSCS